MTARKRSRRGTAVTGPDGTEYCSISSAARALGFNASTVRHHWRRYGHLHYLGGWAVPCEHRGKKYGSLAEMSKAIGIKRHTLTYHLQRYGNFERAGKGRRRGNPGNAGPRKPLRIGPVEWPSKKCAADALGISLSSVSRWTGPNATAQQRDRLLAAVMRLHAERGAMR